MNEKWEEFFNSSILKVKKAIISYNNFLEDDRLENFYIFLHIAFNRIFIAFCVKNNKKYKDNKNKIIEFKQLSNILKKESIITFDENKIISMFNDIRNDIHHNIYKKIENNTINSIENAKFLTSIINLYKRIIFEICPEFNLYENIIYFKNDKNINTSIPVENTYMIKIKEIINKEDLKNFFEKYAKNVIIANDDIKKEDIKIFANEYINPNEINKNHFKPSKIIERIQKQFDPKFNQTDFTNIIKYFSVLSLQTQKNNWEPLNISKNYEKVIISLEFQKYCYKMDLTKSIIYNKSIIKLLINFLKKCPSDYKIFLKEQKKLKSKGNIMEWYL